jgi:hypothetical protein
LFSEFYFCVDITWTLLIIINTFFNLKFKITMKQIWKFFALAIVMIAFSASSFAQLSATANATASATIIAPITLTRTANLDFGNVVTSPVAGTVTLDPAGVRTAGGGAAVLAAQPGSVSVATFTVGGTVGWTYAITLPASVTIDDAGAGVAMTVDTFTSTPDATSIIPAGGTETLSVGATLNVGVSQVAGLYTSATPFTVTVNYN